MQALIDPRFNRVCQIEPDDSTFPVANPLFWTECPPDVETEWTYENGVFVPPVPYVPTADDNKATAVSILQATDWTTIADVGNPQMSNPYLANQAEFISYRSVIRQYAINPVAGNIDWPVVPQENWQSV